MQNSVSDLSPQVALSGATETIFWATTFSKAGTHF
jgi:hypothetical protein